MVKETTVTELKRYIKNFEEGVAGWMHGLNDRLERMENDLAIVKDHLVTRMREDAGGPGPGAQTPGPATLPAERAVPPSECGR